MDSENNLFDRITRTLCAVNWHAERLYRFSRYLHRRGNTNLAKVVSAINLVFTGAEIPGSCTQIGSGLTIMHSRGIVVHEDTIIGADCVIFQQVTLGERRGVYGRPNKPANRLVPTLGDHVTIYAGAKVLGGVQIGDNAIIGANAVVLDDVPAGATAVGVPALIAQPQGSAGLSSFDQG